MNTIVYFPYTLKENDIKELVNGIIALGDSYTHRQPFGDDIYEDYNDVRCGVICQNESTEIFDGIIIYDIEHKKLRTAIMNPGSSGGFSLMIDVSSCPTDRSKQYFVFQKWKDYTKISRFNVRDRNTTPNKKQRFE